MPSAVAVIITPWGDAEEEGAWLRVRVRVRVRVGKIILFYISIFSVSFTLIESSVSSESGVWVCWGERANTTEKKFKTASYYISDPLGLGNGTTLYYMYFNLYLYTVHLHAYDLTVLLRF